MTPAAARRATPYLLAGLPILALALLVAYPMIYNIGLSLRSYRTGVFVGLHNFARAFDDATLAASVRATAQYVVLAVGIELLLGLVLALFIHRTITSPAVRTLVYLLLIVPMVTPPIAAGVIARLVYTPNYGILNYALKGLGLITHDILWLSSARTAMFSVLSVDLWQWTPFVFLVCYAGLQAVPVDVVEAAKVDGAGGWNQFRLIELPYLKSLLLLLIIFRFTDTFRVFDRRAHVLIRQRLNFRGGPAQQLIRQLVDACRADPQFLREQALPRLGDHQMNAHDALVVFEQPQRDLREDRAARAGHPDGDDLSFARMHGFRGEIQSRSRFPGSQGAAAAMIECAARSMDERDIRGILEAVGRGKLSTAAALERLRHLPFEDLGFAKVDHHRALRQGYAEVVFGRGKTPAQVAEIVRAMLRPKATSHNILVTRADAKIFAAVRRVARGAKFHPVSGAITVERNRAITGKGTILVVSAGTSDIPVAEEAELTARLMGNRVEHLYDVGVAGLHRLLEHRDLLARARVIICVAGMEGALPSVVGGLVGVPVIAVPTSTGYGASFSGITALLGMLNSCASNVSVVNIDNGFGAACVASVINRL